MKSVRYDEEAARDGPKPSLSCQAWRGCEGGGRWWWRRKGGGRKWEDGVGLFRGSREMIQDC